MARWWGVGILALLLVGAACGKSDQEKAASVVMGGASGDDDGMHEPCGGYGGEPWEVFRVKQDKEDPFLNLRKGPSSKKDIVAKLTEGTKVSKLDFKRSWIQVVVEDGEHAGAEGWVYNCCLRPEGGVDFYVARLSAEDHVGPDGQRLMTPGAIVARDRENVHTEVHRDKKDRDDLSFASAKRRAWLEKAVNNHGFPDEEVEKFITERMPLVEIAVCKHNVAISFPDRGKKYQAKRGDKKKLSPGECEQKHCACMFGDGDCNEGKFKKCLKRAGVKDPWPCGAG
jgi:hypothetical protein